MDLSPEAMHKLIGAYRRCLLTPEGETVLQDLRSFAQIDEQAGSELTHAECAYRNGLQDFYRYVDGLLAEN